MTERRAIAYWFLCSRLGRPAALIVDTDRYVHVLVTTKLNTLEVWNLGQTHKTRLEGPGSSVLTVERHGPEFRLEFATPDLAAHVDGVLRWLETPASVGLGTAGFCDAVVLNCVYLGGTDVPLAVSGVYDLIFRPDRLDVYTAPARPMFGAEASFSNHDLHALYLAGPGLVTSGGGFIGGGALGWSAVKGMVAADLLNRLTTRKSVLTSIQMKLQGGEAFFLHTDLTPDQLRVALSPIYTRLSEGAPRPQPASKDSPISRRARAARPPT